MPKKMRAPFVYDRSEQAKARRLHDIFIDHMLPEGFVPDRGEWSANVKALGNERVRPIIASAMVLLGPTGREGGRTRTWTFHEWCQLGQLKDKIELERRKIRRFGDNDEDKRDPYEKAVDRVTKQIIKENVFQPPIKRKRIEQLLADFRPTEDDLAGED